MYGPIVIWLTRLSVIGIIVGILFMIQPFVFELFRYGFYLLLLSTIVYTVVGHLPLPGVVRTAEKTQEPAARLGAPEGSKPN